MDISFPASTLILSDIFPKHYQGIAASLITTVVNYSISIGLGIAGTVESRMNTSPETQDLQQIERGFRAAMWTGVGFAASGLIVALATAAVHEITTRTAKSQERDNA